MVIKGRYEVAGYACGTVNEDELIDEDIDIRTRSIGHFVHRKISGKIAEFWILPL